KTAFTWAALVGETALDRFALGAASGKPHFRMTAWMNGWAGQRTPTVGPSAVTTPGISAERGSTSVSGPGQNDRASWSASGVRPAGTGTGRLTLPRRPILTRVFKGAPGSSRERRSRRRAGQDAGQQEILPGMGRGAHALEFGPVGCARPVIVFLQHLRAPLFF